MAIDTWNVDADGSWSTASNWSTSQVPQTGDDVVIDTADPETIFYDTGAGSSTINSLTVADDEFVVAGGVLSITGSASFGGADSGLIVRRGMLNLNSISCSIGSFEQVGGTVSGSGKLTLSGGQRFASREAQIGSGTTLLEGQTSVSGGLYFDGGRTFENSGALDLQSAYLHLGQNPFGATVGGGAIENDAGATLDVTGFFDVTGKAGADKFINDGALVVNNTATFASSIGVEFTNVGTVSVHAVGLDLTGGGSSSANAFTLSGGATLDFGGGVFTLTGGAFKGSGAIEVTGGTLALGADALVLASFIQSGGTISGARQLTLTNADMRAKTAWIEQTGSGKTLLKGVTSFSGDLALDGGRALENQGTLDWGGEIELGYNPFGNSAGGGTIRNEAGATIVMTSGVALSHGAGDDAFINAGLVTLNSTAVTSYIEIAFTNTGKVSVQAGALDLSDGGSSSASAFTVTSAATLEFSRGTFTMKGGAYASAGLTEISGGVLALGADSGNSADFTQRGGVLAGSGVLTVKHAASFDAAAGAWVTQTGPGTTLLKGVTDVLGSIALDGGRTLENAGTVDWTSRTDIELGFDPHGGTSGGGTIRNETGATFDIAAPVSIVAYAGADAFINKGLLELTETPFTTHIDANFTNTGDVEVRSGTLDLHDAVSGTGALKIVGAATLQLDSAVASGQRIDYSGAALGELILHDLSSGGSQLFHGKIADFAKGDTIDAGAPFGDGTKFVFTENAKDTGGVLALTNGSLHASIDFIGKYAAADFHAHGDGHSGTLLTYG